MSPADLREIERRAGAATPGPWYADEVVGDGRTVVDDGRAGWPNEIRCETPDAQYVAAVDPDSVLALCRALRIAVEALDHTTSTLGEVKQRNTKEFMHHAEMRYLQATRALAQIAALVTVEQPR